MPSYLQKNRWRLNSNHDLEFTVTESKGLGSVEALSLKGEIAGVSSDRLTALITSKKVGGVETTRIIELDGRWQADEKNRLSFAVYRKDGKEDVLVLDGKWETGKDNEILYRYRKTGLKRRDRIERCLVFRGAWRINGTDRISYLLDSSGESGFVFRAQLEKAAIKGKFGALKFRVGIGVSRYKRPVESVVKIPGMVRWDINKRYSLEFDVTGARGRKPGMGLTLSRKLLGGEAFLRLKKLAQGERKAEVGIKFDF
ncbi:MAG: hypothetical protein WC491_02920 [Candidatus Omnitrophota bacterium]|nr:hypothetical protein [Syntrophorhabdaceae bacterium]